jgi:hypothetical protein
VRFFLNSQRFGDSRSSSCSGPSSALRTTPSRRHAALLGLDPMSHARLASTPEALRAASEANLGKLRARGRAILADEGRSR